VGFRKIDLPVKYRSPEMMECYLKGLLEGYGIAKSPTHSNLSPEEGGKHLLEKIIKHNGKTIGEILGRVD